MGDTDDITFTVDIFQKVLANEKHRLAVGAVLRRYIHGQLAKGVEPDHYRMKWLHKGISRIVRQLGMLAAALNAKHPAEMFSTGGMVDVAESVVLKLKRYVNSDADEDSN